MGIVIFFPEALEYTLLQWPKVEPRGSTYFKTACFYFFKLKWPAAFHYFDEFPQNCSQSKLLIYIQPRSLLGQTAQQLSMRTLGVRNHSLRLGAVTYSLWPEISWLPSWSIRAPAFSSVWQRTAPSWELCKQKMKQRVYNSWLLLM